MRAMLRMGAVIAALLMTVAVAAPAFAGHKHDIQTPGTTAVHIASGNTCISDENHAAYHVIHERLHVRTDHPADPLSVLTDGRVTVVKTTDC